MSVVWTLFQSFWKIQSLFFLDELALILTAIMYQIYLLCLILFDIYVLLLIYSNVDMEQFLGLMLGGNKRLHD